MLPSLRVSKTIPFLKTLVIQFLSLPIGYPFVSKNCSMLIMTLKVMVINNIIMNYITMFSILETLLSNKLPINITRGSLSCYLKALKEK